MAAHLLSLGSSLVTFVWAWVAWHWVSPWFPYQLVPKGSPLNPIRRHWSIIGFGITTLWVASSIALGRIQIRIYSAYFEPTDVDFTSHGELAGLFYSAVGRMLNLGSILLVAHVLIRCQSNRSVLRLRSFWPELVCLTGIIGFKTAIELFSMFWTSKGLPNYFFSVQLPDSLLRNGSTILIVFVLTFFFFHAWSWLGFDLIGRQTTD